MRTTGMLARKGVVQEIDDFLSAEPTFKPENFTENTFSCQTFDGKIWGIPWNMPASGAWANISMPGSTSA